MTIDCIHERFNILKKLWDRNHDTKHCDILLQQLKTDIVFFCHERVPCDLQSKIDELQREIYHAQQI